ncbi:hypothetical protein OG216_09795 [Streptomycetaceae bacterium NBC_01309]
MTTALPNWVIDLVADLETYEFEHGHPDDGHICLNQTLKRVPDEIRSQAKAVRAYLAQQQRAALESHVAANLDDVLGGLNKGPTP